MFTSPPTPTLRLGRPDEIDTVVDIDDDASSLFTESGLPVFMTATDDFLDAERRRWLIAARNGRLWVAVDAADVPLGFASLADVDGAPYLDQLSVRRAHMRQGVGSALLDRVLQLTAARGVLWLTTYAHLPFNGPYYARRGFVTVADDACGPRLRAVLKTQRKVLPAPKQRVAMVYRHLT